MADVRATATPPIIVAHRGLHTRFPENSLAAFDAAWHAGLLWCECDIQQTADGHWIILHDADLDRTTTGAGLICTQYWRALRDVRLKDSHERLPSLANALARMPAGRRMVIEIKSRLIAADVRSLLALDAESRCLWQSFDAMNLHLLREANSSVALAYLVKDRAALAGAESRFWTRLFVEHRLFEEARRLYPNATLGAWTVNAPEDIRRVLDAHASAIISDDPLRVRQIFDASSANEAMMDAAG